VILNRAVLWADFLLIFRLRFNEAQAFSDTSGGMLNIQASFRLFDILTFARGLLLK
jgi:hypothetical protein